MLKRYPAKVSVVVLHCDKCEGEMSKTGEVTQDSMFVYQCGKCDFRLYSKDSYPYSDITPDYGDGEEDKN